MIKPLLKLRRRRVPRKERWIVPMKRGIDITHGWLKTGFFDIGLRYTPPNRTKNPVSLVLTRKFCSTKRA